MVMDQHGFKTAFQHFFSKDFVFFGSFFHLWFISSLAFGYLLIAFFYQFEIKYLLFPFSVAILIIALLSASYPVLSDDYSFAYTNHLLSIPFLYIGFQFYKKGFPSLWICLLLILAGIIMQIEEARFIYRIYGLSAYDHEFLIGTIPFAIGMTGLAFNNPKWLQWSLFSEWGRNDALGIYLVHLLVIYLIKKFTSMLLPQISENAIWQVIFPVLILAICVLLLEMIKRFLPTFYNFLYGRHTKA